MTSVRDDTATTSCPVCAARFEPEGQQRFCSTGCRQQPGGEPRSAVQPVVARSDTVYQCPNCDARYLGEQRCEDCNTWCRKRRNPFCKW